ncbi:FUN14 domain-containing protein 1 [Manduca sexta]|uniref:FUN14 domain-containing protein 1 n=1 Tax=Manduca sexta TaxID=7130 RepID=UPI00188F73A9|nr:FUN14 domain-containing protein 1 [Manduca sexta]
MARPIPSIHPRDLTHFDEIKPRASKSLVNLAIDTIKDKSSKNLVLGTVTGWATGASFVRVGKIAAFGLGGGVLLLHFATELGYIQVNWERIREAAAESQACVECFLQFVKKNSCFTVGFIGGFCFGVASS